MLKWVIWVSWERKKDVYFLKHEGHEEHEERIIISHRLTLYF